jgi:anti-sigma regulatory factor (Ser/Thr protein kinase)
MIAVRVHGIDELGVTVPTVVARLAVAAGLTRGQAYRLRLATEEITTNIVIHGYGGCGRAVDIDAGYDADWAWLRIEDDAPEFDPTEYDPASKIAEDPRLPSRAAGVWTDEHGGPREERARGLRAQEGRRREQALGAPSGARQSNNALGGFGLFLAMSSVDRLEHTYSGGRNRILLKVRRNGGTYEEATHSGGG